MIAAQVLQAGHGCLPPQTFQASLPFVGLPIQRGASLNALDQEFARESQHAQTLLVRRACCCPHHRCPMPAFSLPRDTARPPVTFGYMHATVYGEASRRFVRCCTAGGICNQIGALQASQGGGSGGGASARFTMSLPPGGGSGEWGAPLAHQGVSASAPLSAQPAASSGGARQGGMAQQQDASSSDEAREGRERFAARESESSVAMLREKNRRAATRCAVVLEQLPPLLGMAGGETGMTQQTGLCLCT